MTLKKLIEDHIRHLESRNLTPKCIQHKRNALISFAHTNSIKRPEDIFPEHIRRYEGKLLDEGFASSTKRFKLGSLREFLLLLRDKGLVLFDASALITLPKPVKNLPRVILTEDEMKLLFSLPVLNRMKGIRIRTILEILYGTGIRRAELLHIDLYDLDMRERTLLVRQGKGRKDRLLPVPRTTLKYVKEYIETVRSGRNSRERALLLDRGGRRLDDNELQGTVHHLGKVARDRLGIKKKITCHVFRHSIATHLVQRGVDIRYVQAFLGHADLSSTQIYTRVAASHMARELLRSHPRDKMKVPLK